MVVELTDGFSYYAGMSETIGDLLQTHSSRMMTTSSKIEGKCFNHSVCL